jgi:hypothetical protein
MKITKFSLTASFMFFSFMAFSKTTSQASVKSVAPKSVEGYLLIQKQLAADSFEGVVPAASQITKNEKGELSLAAAKLSKSKNIEEAREKFKKVSDLLIVGTSEKERMGAKVAFCPMAQAQWLQLGDTLKNPYYGSSMLECGRFESKSPSQK